MRCLPFGSSPTLRGACLGMVVGLFLLEIASAADQPAPGRKQAETLNTEGFRLYNQKKFPEALEKFRAAAEADPTYAHAQYNLACTLGILRKQGLVCQYDAYAGAILAPLREALRLDPKRLAKARRDPDLASIHDTYGWQLIDGLDPKNSADLQKILVRVRWYGPAPGAYGPLFELDFAADGRVTMKGKELLEDSMQPYEKCGTFKVKGLEIELKLEGKDLKGSLDPEGKLQIEGLEGPITDDAGECSA
jgi:hypothetical protein